MTPNRLIAPWTPPPRKTYVLQNANIVDPMTGTVQPNRTVILADGIIEAVNPSSPVLLPSAQHIDCTAKFLTPGLIDAHIHISSVPGAPTLSASIAPPPSVSLLRQPFVLAQILSRGFTTVRDCGGASLALKDALAANVFPGPRLFIANRALSQTGGHADLRGPHDQTQCCGGHVTGLGVLCDGVPECVKAAREQLRTGADFVKIMCGGGVASPTDALANTQFTAEEVRAVVEVARSYGTWVTAHAYTVAAIRHAVENGVMGIEHGNFVDRETAELMRERGVFLTPTLVAYEAMSSDRFPGFLPPESESKNKEVLARGLGALEIAAEVGVTMCYGSDLLGPLGVDQTKEFGLRKKVLSDKLVLQSATVNPARMLRQEGFLGQIKEGFAADVLILNENPLENVEIFDRPEEHLLAVIKDGRVCSSRWSKLSVETEAVEMIE